MRFPGGAYKDAWWLSQKGFSMLFTHILNFLQIIDDERKSLVQVYNVAQLTAMLL